MSFGSKASREEAEVISFEEDQGENLPEHKSDDGVILEKFFSSRTERGKDILRKNGFEYIFDKESKSEEGIEIWKCLKTRPYCPGRICVKKDWNDESGKRYKLGKIQNEQHKHGPIDPSV